MATIIEKIHKYNELVQKMVSADFQTELKSKIKTSFSKIHADSYQILFFNCYREEIIPKELRQSYLVELMQTKNINFSDIFLPLFDSINRGSLEYRFFQQLIILCFEK